MNFPFAGDIVVVVAHPDDEVLWLGAAVPFARKIVMVLPGHAVNTDLAAARARAIAGYPLKSLECLPLQTAGVNEQSDRLRRRPIEYGVSLMESCPKDCAERYRTNFTSMCRMLEIYMHKGATVFAHNPWGEYGHEEHVQVNHAVMQLAQRHGCSVWAWEGFSAASQIEQGVRLRADHYPEGPISKLPSVELNVDLDMYLQIRDLYQRHGAWTWADDYLPPNPSRYIQLVRAGRGLIDAEPGSSPRRAGMLTRWLPSGRTRAPAVPPR
jgi:LmbE family N-acetylglucosaminyl deacetylase